MRKYTVHNLFGPTLQGEGAMTGTVCHFIRLSGCNMWDGRPETRADSLCPFCDTDFLKGTKMTALEIVKGLRKLGKVNWVTISGGEPALQLDSELVNTLQRYNYKVAIETNGTKPINVKVDHLTMSPKLPADQIVVLECDSLKLLYPHPNPEIRPENFEHIKAASKFLQPIDYEDKEKNERITQATIKKLYELPDWKLSPQVHKFLGVE